MPAPPPAGTLEQIAQGLLRAFEPLGEELQGDNLLLFLDSLGFSFPESLRAQPGFTGALAQTAARAVALPGLLIKIKQAVETENAQQAASALADTAGVVKALLESFEEIKTALEGVGNLGGTIDAAQMEAFALNLAERLLGYLVVYYMEGYAPVLLRVLHFTDLVQIEDVQGANTPNGPSAHRLRKLNIGAIKSLLEDPVAHFVALYKWGRADFDGKALFKQFSLFSQTFALPISVDLEAAVPEIKFSIATLRPKTDTPEKGLELVLKPDLPRNFETELPFVFDHTFLKIKMEAGFPTETRVWIFPKGKIEIVPPSGDINGRATFTIVRRPDTPNGEIMIFGQTGGTRFTAKSISAGFGIGATWDGTQAKGDYRFFFAFEKGEIVIALGGGDGFIAQLAPKELRLNADMLIGYTSDKGFYFEGSAGFEMKFPMHIALGPLEILDLTVKLRLQSGLVLEAGAGFKVNLGPLVATVENIGVRTLAEFPADGRGNFGPFDLSLGFKPPNGVGLSIDAGVVKGGGYLFFDFDREEYAGVMELTFSGVISLKAIGMITTKMPDGSKGFSLLIIISVEFGTGIQLGYGFTLLGVGGLLGLNRTANADALLQGIRNGRAANVMFPRDLVANAPRIISDLRAYFPVEVGKFLIGPFVKLGWGTPTLVSVSLGVIVEFSAQDGFGLDSITILGVLRVALPEERVALLVLQVQFIGRIEISKRRAWFFASLFDSRVLFLTIEGEMGLLIDWSDNPNFVLSVGGFHPRFTPPPMPFPVPRRIAVELSNNPLFRIRVEGYFAVTANTVQFGARAELMCEIGDVLRISGHISFDALFQFSPFYFQIAITASVSVQVFGIGLFGIALEFTLEGPTPWRAYGKGSITLLFFTVSANFDITWGERADTLLPPVDVFPLFRAEFEKEQNWKAELPVGQNLSVSLRKLESVAGEDATVLVLHPLGVLRIAQRAVPLAISLDKIGSQKVGDYKKLRITEQNGSFSVAPSNEQFAMGQFQNMSDAEKISRPAFQRQQGGVVLTAAGNGGFKTGRAAKRLVRYETIIVDTEHKRRVFKFFRWLGVFFTHYLKGNAVSKSPLSQHQKRLASPFVEKIEVLSGTRYEVAFVRNNVPIAPATQAFANEALAREYLQQALSENPALADQIHVIPQFEANR